MAWKLKGDAEILEAEIEKSIKNIYKHILDLLRIYFDTLKLSHHQDTDKYENNYQFLRTKILDICNAEIRYLEGFLARYDIKYNPRHTHLYVIEGNNGKQGD